MRLSVLFVASLMAMGFMAFSFSSAGGSESQWLDVPVHTWGKLEQARATHKQIEVTKAKEIIFRQDDLLIVDVRTPEEFRAGHIPGAVNIPRGFLEFEIGEMAEKSARPILVYCKEGLRGALAGSTLRNLGYTNVSNLIGGWEAWSRYQKEGWYL